MQARSVEACSTTRGNRYGALTYSVYVHANLILPSHEHLAQVMSANVHWHLMF